MPNINCMLMKALRTALNLTQEEFWKMCPDIETVDTIQRVESGRRVREATLRQIADALSIAPNLLLAEENVTIDDLRVNEIGQYVLVQTDLSRHNDNAVVGRKKLIGITSRQFQQLVESLTEEVDGRILPVWHQDDFSENTDGSDAELMWFIHHTILVQTGPNAEPFALFGHDDVEMLILIKNRLCNDLNLNSFGAIKNVWCFVEPMIPADIPFHIIGRHNVGFPKQEHQVVVELNEADKA